MKRKRIHKKARAFTLLEALIAVVVLGILTYMSLPKFYSISRRISNQEAHTILLALYGEQMKYAQENGSFCNSISQLDVEIPAPEKFNAIPVGSALHGTVTCSGVTVAYLASLTSVDNNYALYVLADGTIACTPCPSAVCSNMGFGNFSAAPALCAADSDCHPKVCALPPGICINW